MKRWTTGNEARQEGALLPGSRFATHAKANYIGQALWLVAVLGSAATCEQLGVLLPASRAWSGSGFSGSTVGSINGAYAHFSLYIAE